MICKFCGNEIEDGSDFCFICGQKVEPTESVQTPAQEEAPANVVVAQTPAETVPQTEKKIEAAPADNSKAAKKAAKKARAGKFTLFICFLFAIIGLLVYRKAKKDGYEEKAVSILNAIVLGLDVKMALIIAFMVKKYML